MRNSTLALWAMIVRLRRDRFGHIQYTRAACKAVGRFLLLGQRDQWSLTLCQQSFARAISVFAYLDAS